MIHAISIENFKLYRQRTTFENLKSINVLTGINGRGKSTLLQAMLLPKQSLLESRWNDKLVLNGDYVRLGNAIDVRNESNRRVMPIVFDYITDYGNINLQFSAEDGDAQKLPLIMANEFIYTDDIRLTNFIPDVSLGTNKGLSDVLSHITYVAAERKGPDLNYPPAPEHGQMDAMGTYAPSLLALHKDDTFSNDVLEGLTDIFPNIDIDDLSGNSLNSLINFWLTQMFGMTEVDAKYVSEANVYVLNIVSSLKKNASKPTNVGFGYGYVLPILVAGLTALYGDVLVIENPEAHLHPKAQSILGKFLTWIACYRGVQLFVETHSEHIVNSFRVMVSQEVLTSSSLNILFFDERYEQYAVQIPVNEKGRISEWPEFFFDQEEKDLDILL